MNYVFCNKLKVILSEEFINVRVCINSDVYIVTNQDVDTIAAIIYTNFTIVYNHYVSALKKHLLIVSENDLSEVSAEIVVRYICKYSMWVNTYPKYNNDLSFDVNNFNHPTTHDWLIHFFSKKYGNWKDICAALIDKSIVEFEAYYSEREHFYNR